MWNLNVVHPGEVNGLTRQTVSRTSQPDPQFFLANHPNHRGNCTTCAIEVMSYSAREVM
jgi:hypothetical protein